MTGKLKLKDLILCALFAAVCCIFSTITIPIGVVPVTLGLFGVMVTPMIIGTKRGMLSVVIFILLGTVGLQVFSNFTGGIGVLLGPTGGYIYSFILVALITGLFSKKLDTSFKSRAVAFCGCILGIIVCYVIGTAHFMLVYANNGGLLASLTLCVFPFVPFDLLKAALAVIIAPRLKKALNKA